MSWGRRFAILGAGVLSGLVAALAMILVMAAARTWLGIAPLPESVPDRLPPSLSIKAFFDLFGKYGGYNGLKKFGIKSGIEGMLAAGVVVGLLYALVVESRRSRVIGFWRWGLSKAGLLLVGALVVLMWVGTVIFLWPVLQTNFRGLPPTQARYTSIAGVLVNYLVFAITLIAAYRFVIRRREPEPAVLPEPMPEPKLVPVAAPNGLTVQVAQPLPEPLPVMPAPTASLTPVGQPLARRAVVAAGAGALMAIPTYRLVKDLYDRAVFPYDGTVYSGPGVQPLTPNEKFYTVTKNVVDPNVKKAVWGLDINCHVGQ